MNEFNKPYEYFEENGVGGVLLILFFMLIAIEPLLGVIATFMGYDSLKSSGIWGIIFLCVAVVFIVYAIFSGFALKRIRSHAIVITKVFLIFRLLFLLPFSYLNMDLQIKAIPYVNTESLYMETYNNLVISFAISLAYVIGFSAVWYIYLNKSKRVREFYPQKGIGV